MNVGPAPTMSLPPKNGRGMAKPRTVSPNPVVRSPRPFWSSVGRELTIVRTGRTISIELSVSLTLN
jgi:hypothetical protein